jgi:hypothetical protein
VTRDEPLTPDARDAMTEDELLAHDLRDAIRGPGVSEDMHRSLIRGRIRRERAASALRKRADEVGSTPAAILQAEAEKRAAERDRQARRDLAAARAAVKAPSPRGRGPEPIVTAQEAADAYEATGSYKKAAKRLGVHPSTIRRRLGRL